MFLLQGQLVCHAFFISHIMWYLMRVPLCNGNTQIRPCNLHLCFHHKRNGGSNLSIIVWLWIKCEVHLQHELKFMSKVMWCLKLCEKSYNCILCSILGEQCLALHLLFKISLPKSRWIYQSLNGLIMYTVVYCYSINFDQKAQALYSVKYTIMILYEVLLRVYCLPALVCACKSGAYFYPQCCSAIADSKYPITGGYACDHDWPSRYYDRLTWWVKICQQKKANK